MKEKIRKYVIQLREAASHTPLSSSHNWAVEQERCDALNQVADSLEEILMEEEEFEFRKQNKTPYQAMLENGQFDEMFFISACQKEHGCEKCEDCKGCEGD
jgi:hypothetical protein